MSNCAGTQYSPSRSLLRAFRRPRVARAGEIPPLPARSPASADTPSTGAAVTDISTDCDRGHFQAWPGHQQSDPGQLDDVYILDVDGNRVPSERQLLPGPPASRPRRTPIDPASTPHRVADSHRRARNHRLKARRRPPPSGGGSRSDGPPPCSREPSRTSHRPPWQLGRRWRHRLRYRRCHFAGRRRHFAGRRRSPRWPVVPSRWRVVRRLAGRWCRRLAGTWRLGALLEAAEQLVERADRRAHRLRRRHGCRSPGRDRTHRSALPHPRTRGCSRR